MWLRHVNFEFLFLMNVKLFGRLKVLVTQCETAVQDYSLVHYIGATEMVVFQLLDMPHLFPGETQVLFVKSCMWTQ